jgi:redox-sensitive bicupin YhaK (pirin superfamily)
VVVCIAALHGGVNIDGEWLKSPINSQLDINCLVTDLNANTQWVYQPPEGHDVAWVYVFEGQADVCGVYSQRGMQRIMELRGKTTDRRDSILTRLAALLLLDLFQTHVVDWDPLVRLATGCFA